MEDAFEGRGEGERPTGVPRVNIRRGGGVSNEAGREAGAGEAGEAGSKEEEEKEEAEGSEAGDPIFGKRSISASPVSGLARHTTFTFLVRA